MTEANPSPGRRRRVVVLGSTGSIGASALDVIRHLDGRLQAFGLSAHSRWETLLQQAQERKPRYLHATDAESARRLKDARMPAGMNCSMDRMPSPAW